MIIVLQAAGQATFALLTLWICFCVLRDERSKR